MLSDAAARLKLTGFVLAGGASRRMGRDKALLPWRDGTLLEHMTRKMATVAGRVRVVGRGDLPDRQPDRGPVEGIATALSVTATEYNLIVAVDLPELDPGFLEYMAGRLETSGSGLVTCRVADATPLCLGIRSGRIDAVDRYLDSGERSLRGLLETIAHETIDEKQIRDAGFSIDMFRNLNSPEDLRRLPER